MPNVDAILAETRLKVNITLWMLAVQRKLRETTDPAQRELLARMYVEFARRLP